MFWYLVICVLMLYPLTIVRVGNLSDRKTDEVALISGCLILWFFMAMRGTTVGVDTRYYAYVYQQFVRIPFSKVFTAVTYATESETWAFDFEPGYRLVNKLLSLFFPGPQAITVFNSTVIILLAYVLIRRNSPNFLLSLWLYITLGVYQTEMNVTRNAIAILLVFNGFSYVTKGQFGKYLVCCLAASMFHVAALVFIPVYWLLRRFQPSFSKCCWIVGAFLLVGLCFPVISPYIRMVLPSSLDKYFLRGNNKMASLMVGILNAGVFALTAWLIGAKGRKQAFKDYSVGIIMLMLNLCFFGLNVGLDYAARMAGLFGPYLIILVPQMLGLIESETRKRNAEFLVSVVCGCQYVLRLFVNNIGGTMPYVFFW